MVFSTSWTPFAHTTGNNSKLKTAPLHKLFTKRGLTNCMCVCVSVYSVEKDGSALSDERKTVQTSLFDLLKDFLLKSSTTKELHSVLAYTAVVQDQQQVTHRFLSSLHFLGSLSSHNV